MYKSLLTLLFILPFLGFAQEDFYPNPLFYFEKESKQKIFSDYTKVRSEPNLQSSVTDSLNAGQDIEIVKVMDKVLALGLRSAHWYQIKYNDKTGYVWGGNISVGYRTRAPYTFIYGISKSENRTRPTTGERYTVSIGSVKVLAENRILDETSFEIENADSLVSAEFQVSNNNYLKNVDYIIKATSGAEACGIPTYEQYILFANQKLTKLPLLSSVSDANIYYHSEEFAFPKDEKSQGKIIYTMEEGESEDEDSDPKVTQKDKKIYHWDGNTLKF